MKKTEKKYEEIIVPGSERSIISICLKNPEKIIDCESEELFAEHFGIPAHRYIYMAMLYLYSKEVKPTPIAILEVIVDETAKKSIEKIGGLEYLSLLAEGNKFDDDVKIYCKKVKQAHIRRIICDICDETIEEMLDASSEVLNEQELVSKLENKIVDLSVQSTTMDDIYKMGTSTEQILKERAKNPQTIPGLEVGNKFTKFNRLTNGGRPGDLIFVCARAKTGKSTLLKSWSTNIGIIDKLPVLYIDTEMDSRDQEDRILADLSNIPYNEIISGSYVLDTANGLAKDKIERLKYATKMLQEGEFYYTKMPQFTADKVNSLTRKFKIQKNIVALFFDYLKLPANQVDTLKNIKEWQSLGFLASGLKDLGSILDIPVFSACQENRSDSDPTKKSEANVGGSDRILQLATKLIFLYDKTDKQIALEGAGNGNQQLYIAFQRNGESKCEPINIFFNKPYMRMEEI